MRIAVAVENNAVSQHFGHCEGFEVFEIVDGSINEKYFVENPGHKRGLLPRLMADENVEAVIAGGMGAMAQEMLKESGINICVGITGNADDMALKFASGNLESSSTVCNDHAHRDSCGEE